MSDPTVEVPVPMVLISDLNWLLGFVHWHVKDDPNALVMWERCKDGLDASLLRAAHEVGALS